MSYIIVLFLFWVTKLDNGRVGRLLFASLGEQKKNNSS
jgi:hypothetical protein